MCDINNRKKPKHISEEDWKKYEDDLEEAKKARQLDREYRDVTKGFDGDRYGLTKEEYQQYASDIDKIIEEGESLDRRIGQMCNVHINCGCKIIKQDNRAYWQTSGNANVCQDCISLQNVFNASNIKNKLDILNKINNKSNMEKINNLVEYIYTIDSSVEEPIVLISEDIGNGYGEVSGTQVAKEILALDAAGKKKIKVYINSLGGSVSDGLSIFDAIVRSKATIDTYCIGIAASIAGVIFLAGRNRYMVSQGLAMTHNPWMKSGNTESEYLSRTRQTLLRMICERTGLSEAMVSDLMNRETWMDAEEAMTYGYATEIINSSDYNVKRSRVNNLEELKESHREFSLIMNKVLGISETDIKNKNEINNMNLNKINAKLGLNEEASADSTLKAITELVEVKNTLDESKNAYDKMKADLDASIEAYNKCVEEMNALKAEMAEVESKNKKEKASEMVKNYANLGKIKNEAKVIEDWTIIAEGNLEVTKNLLENLPFIGKTAVTIPTNSTNTLSGVSNEHNDIALAMAKIKERNSK